ncbi:unnamed protein product [Trichogramma brassicae]|uniref:Uncharacterized protein n=1 Tax=Trichogramma brassicae TaxID=86971 RepID=A0A6H5I3I3_9HYME|nr:unnamed protein product [Trichogramma brassicae]
MDDKPEIGNTATMHRPGYRRYGPFGALASEVAPIGASRQSPQQAGLGTGALESDCEWTPAQCIRTRSSPVSGDSPFASRRSPFAIAQLSEFAGAHARSSLPRVQYFMLLPRCYTYTRASSELWKSAATNLGQ